MGREGEGQKQFLGKFNGLLQTNGYKGYNHVGGLKTVCACCLPVSPTARSNPSPIPHLLRHHVGKLTSQLNAIQRRGNEGGL